MILPAGAALAAAWSLGFLAVANAWDEQADWGAAAGACLAALGLGMGLGLTSAIFFLASLVAAHPAGLASGSELALCALLAGRLWRRGRRPPFPGTRPRMSWAAALAASLFGSAAVAALILTARAGATEPYGSWDGWAIWNLHARFLFWGGPQWTGVLRAPELGWSHLDYPWLVPASVARMWSASGGDAGWASAVVSTAFGVATVALLVAATARLRGPLLGAVAGLALLGTPFFVTFSSNEHADIPLGYFILASLVLTVFSHRDPGAKGIALLAGLAAGCAAWTKNEGLLFVLVLGGVWSWARWRGGRPPPFSWFLAGLGLALVPLGYFKGVLAPANDLLAGGLGGRLAWLAEGARHRLIWTALRRDALGFGEWAVVPYAALGLALVGRGGPRWQRGEGLVAAALALLLVGYYGVYLLSPHDLAWQLDFSLVRLLLQVWPAGLFLWALTVPRPAAEVAGPAGRAAPWVVANLALAGLVVLLLSRQAPVNQLAAVHAGAETVRALDGGDWFPAESYGRDQWRWSGGKSTLYLEADGPGAGAPVTLHFGIRGLGTRFVTARLGGRVVWHGRVGAGLAAVTVSDLQVPGGFASLVFTTDAPGVRESDRPDARALAYALYNVRLQ